VSFYVDVHTHLTHEDFNGDRDQVIDRARHAGLGAIVVNGLEPRSNRKILDMSKLDPLIRPALGIYPLDAVCQDIPADFPFPVPKFDVLAEIEFIRSQASAGNLAAIGECGLDGYYLDDSLLPAQERVFEALIEVAMNHQLPIIIHTRKCEKRAGDILAAHGATKVNFHCFGGRVSLAKEYAETRGWWFSIPANCTVNEGFQKMLKVLPPEKLLTETDAPYLAPVRGQRNEPAHVVGTVARLAEYRGWSHETAKKQVYDNYTCLFGTI
jgi:TatD DNase family protein